MKSFTAKEFSRCPAKVYEAAMDDGKVEITHDRFGGKFQIYYMPMNTNEIQDGAVIRVQRQQLRVVPWKEKAPD